VPVELRPGTLWPAALARSRAALASGALRPIATESVTVEEAGARFVVRVLAGPEREDPAAGAREGGASPFLPIDPELFVADVSDTHFAVLNKFPVVERHLLVVTRAFDEQEDYLGRADFEALAACLAEGPAVAFYNSGPAAGASQRHKHLQLVPAPLGAGPEAMPIEPLLARGTLPFRARAERVDGFAAGALHERYRAALAGLGLAGARAPSAPYNLLVTSEWLVLVPRSGGLFGAVPVNALGFAGALLVRDRAELARVRGLGPLEVLSAVARPA
jgi:ATP adenylyltransferase